MGLLFIVCLFFLTEGYGVKKSVALIISTVVLLCIPLLLVWSVHGDSYDSIVESLNETLNSRLVHYKLAFDLFMGHPLIGIGPGNYLNRTGLIHSHSMVMQVLAEGGLLGIGGILYLFWRLGRYLTGKVKMCRSRYRYIIMAGTAAFLCFTLDNMFDFTLAHGIGIQLGIVLALIDSEMQWS